MAREKVGKTKTISRLEGRDWGNLQRERQMLRKKLEQMEADQKKANRALDAVDDGFKTLGEKTKEATYGASRMEKALKSYWDEARMDQRRIVILKPRSSTVRILPMDAENSTGWRKITKAWVELEDGRKYEVRLSECDISAFDVIDISGCLGPEVTSQEILALPPISEETPSSYQRKFRKVNGGGECG